LNKRWSRTGGHNTARTVPDSRDREWSVALREAAAELLLARPKLIRASRAAIVAEANIYVLHRSVIHKLPLCRAVLAEVEESVEQFQFRRLAAEAQRMISSGEVIVGWKLLERVGIPMPRLTPKLKAAVAGLERTME